MTGVCGSNNFRSALPRTTVAPSSLADAQQARIEPLLPDRTPMRGGSWRDHREAIDAIAFKFQNGTQWCACRRSAEAGAASTTWIPRSCEPTSAVALVGRHCWGGCVTARGEVVHIDLIARQ
ncbi:transposase [Streptomyces tibetensis]|uniref:transposase n=1 Tax=Streptomyces tibetensis TaxID=2382123 RepID=UPI003404D774